MADGGVLTGPEIEHQCRSGNIVIDPFNQDQVNPASYDLRLGSKVAVYKRAVDPGVGHPWNSVTPRSVESLTADSIGGNLVVSNATMDARESQEVWEFDMNPDRGWLLKPGIGYLMHTAERVRTDKYVPVLDGKSSIGRLFVTVHVTAGYGDTGFDGQYTLEVVSTHPVIVYPGMRFCQIRFMTAVGEVMDYKKRGNYTGKAAMGPVPSRAWAQFEEGRTASVFPFLSFLSRQPNSTYSTAQHGEVELVAMFGLVATRLAVSQGYVEVTDHGCKYQLTDKGVLELAPC